MLTELVEMMMHHFQRDTGLYMARRIRSSVGEQGFSLLGTTVVLALVMGLLVWGTLVMTRQSAISTYQVNNVNQARTAALIGISALTRYAQQQYKPSTAATASGNSGSNSGLIVNLLGSLLTSNSPGLPTSGNGAVAAYVPVGTNATTAIAFSAPYMAATVSAVVAANTFSVSPSPTGTPGQIIIVSHGTSGSARATAVGVLQLRQIASNGQSSASAPYNVYVQGSASFNGAGSSNANIGITGTATFNGAGSYGAVDAGSFSGSGNLQLGLVRSVGNYTINGHPDYQVESGGSGEGSYSGATTLTPAQLTALKNQLNTPPSSINAEAFQQYAGIQFLAGDGGGQVVIEPWEASALGLLDLTNSPITYNLDNSAEMLLYGNNINNKICGSSNCINYSGGNWNFSGLSNLNAFIYVQGNITINGGDSGTQSTPSNLPNSIPSSNNISYQTIASTGSMIFDGAVSIYSYAAEPGLCSGTTSNPVCANGAPIPALAGLALISGSPSQQGGITFNGSSNIYGTIAAYGSNATNIDGSSNIYGGIVLESANNNALLNVNGSIGQSIPNATTAEQALNGTTSQQNQNLQLTSLYWQ